MRGALDWLQRSSPKLECASHFIAIQPDTKVDDIARTSLKGKIATQILRRFDRGSVAGKQDSNADRNTPVADDLEPGTRLRGCLS